MFKKGKKKWLIGLAALTLGVQVLVSADVLPPVANQVVNALGHLLAPEPDSRSSDS